jgi:hypothetical protein
MVEEDREGKKAPKWVFVLACLISLFLPLLGVVFGIGAILDRRTRQQGIIILGIALTSFAVSVYLWLFFH